MPHNIRKILSSLLMKAGALFLLTTLSAHHLALGVPPGTTSGLVFDRPKWAKPMPQTNISSGNGLRVFWWNIEKGFTNEYAGGDALNKNLIALATSPKHIAPDVFFLGEFQYDAINRDTLTTLRTHYKEIFIPYSPYTSDFGMVAYIRDDLRYELFPLEPLPWAPTKEYRETWLAKNPYEVHLFDRYYTRLRVERPGQAKVNIVPVHMAQPWSVLQRDLEKQHEDQFLGKQRAFVKTVKAILFEKDNPLVRQASALQQRLEADFGPRIDREPVLMLGDFNIPVGVGPISAPGYQVLQTNFTPAFTKSTPTFPARSAAISSRVRKLHLDHAFSSIRLKTEWAKVLYLKGSDHYPILVSVSEQDPKDAPCPSEQLLVPMPR